MDCPKCGTTQDDAREECVSCGIIFDRWQRAQEEAILRPRKPEPLPVIDEGVGIPKTLIFAGLVVILIFGTIWTVKRRDARSKIDNKAMVKAELNRLNNEGLKVRQRLADEQARAQRMRNNINEAQPIEEMPQATSTAPRAFSLTEGDVMTSLLTCPELSETHIIKLPKQYYSSQRNSVFEQYPELFAAQRSRLLTSTVENDLVTQQIGVTGGIIIDDRDDHFEVLLGRKRITRISDMQGTADRVSITFTWSYEQPLASEVLQGFRERQGHATFLRQDAAWRRVSANISDGKVLHMMCGQ